MSYSASEKTLTQAYDYAKLTCPNPQSAASEAVELVHGSAGQIDDDGAPEFSFSDLQRLEFIEEKANETLLVLKTNSSVLADLKEHYRRIADSTDWPHELQIKCTDDIAQFSKRVGVVERDLQMQQTRLKTLLRLLAGRKSLVLPSLVLCKQAKADTGQLHGILEYRNLQASKLLGAKSQQSAGNMEIITAETLRSTGKMEIISREMHEIAQKTKQETVSMRIITFVTLCFLPGTFISVSCSHLPLDVTYNEWSQTLMSTDVVGSQTTSNGTMKNFVQPKVLAAYFAISLPLTLVTLLIWYGAYRWESRREQQRRCGRVSRSEV